MGRKMAVALSALVVVGIVAYLVIAPMVLRGREKCGPITCKSNVKQMVLATEMYAQDWADTLPGEDWVEQIFPYLKNRQIFVCTERRDLPVGYAMNRRLLGGNPEMIRQPGETVLVFCSDLGGDSPVGGPEAVPAEGIHDGGINVGFADGWVKRVSLKEARRLLAMPVD